MSTILGRSGNDSFANPDIVFIVAEGLMEIRSQRSWKTKEIEYFNGFEASRRFSAVEYISWLVLT